MSILTELKKLTKKKNATVVSQALPDSLDGSGSGGDSSGGGANVLMLYIGEKDGDTWAYKNPECTEEYTSYDEAKAAINAASILKLKAEDDSFVYPVAAGARIEDNREFVAVASLNDESVGAIYLWCRYTGPGDPVAPY